jgi:hypothetical protein
MRPNQYRTGLIFDALVNESARRSGTSNARASPAQPRLKMTGHLTEAVYRRYAIVDEAMLREASTKLAALHRGEAAKTSEVSRSANERATIRRDADREDSRSRLLLFVSVALSCAAGRQT